MLSYSYNQPVAQNNFKVEKKAEANFPSRWGTFRILGFEGFPGEDAKIESALRWLSL
jgi:hypothetical protein